MPKDPFTFVPENTQEAEPTWVLQPQSVLLPSGEFAEGWEVVIEAGLISTVQPCGTARLEGVPTLQAPGRTLLPGLIDTHVHLTFSADQLLVENITRDTVAVQLARAAGNAQRAIARGVTTAVDCGGRTEVVLALREGLSRGMILGPRLLVAGAPITTTAGHCHWLGGTADTTDDVIRVAREQVAGGVDVIKVMLTGGNLTAGSNPTRLQYPVAAMDALAEECDRLGKPLIVHAHSEEGVAVAARVGARVVAHATCGDRDGRIDGTADLLRALAAAGCYVDPTLLVGRLHTASTDSDAGERRRRQREAMLPVFRRMRELGIQLLAGTDAGVPDVPHGSTADSVVALHREVGMPVAEAVMSATSAAARAFDLSAELGEIREGALADLLLVDGLVATDIEAITRPVSVWKSGRLLVNQGSLAFA